MALNGKPKRRVSPLADPNKAAHPERLLSDVYTRSAPRVCPIGHNPVQLVRQSGSVAVFLTFSKHGRSTSVGPLSSARARSHFY